MTITRLIISHLNIFKFDKYDKIVLLFFKEIVLIYLSTMNKDSSSHPGLTPCGFINWEMLTHFDLLLYLFSHESIDYLAQYLREIHVLYVYAYKYILLCIHCPCILQIIQIIYFCEKILCMLRI